MFIAQVQEKSRIWKFSKVNVVNSFLLRFLRSL